MGNYEQLKQAISDVIKTNGNQEITGSLLQNTLLSIISTIGSNSTFAGIATPETNPGTPDQNVFYIASNPGVYSNFGGITVDNGEVDIIKWDGKWTKLVTGIGSSYRIDELSNTVANFTTVIGDSHKINELSQSNIGGVNASDGTIKGGFTNFFYSDISIPNGSTSVTYQLCKTSESNKNGVAFFNGDEYISGKYNTTESDGTLTTISIPKNATIFRFCYYTESAASSLKFPKFDYVEFSGLPSKNINEKINDVENTIDFICNEKSEIKDLPQDNIGGVNAADGTIKSNFTNFFYSDIRIPSKATKVTYQLCKTTDSNKNGVAFFNGNSYISGKYNTTENDGTFTTIDIPNGANIFRFCYYTDAIAGQLNKPVFKYVKFNILTLPSLDDRINDIENNSGSGTSKYEDRPETGCKSFSVKVNVSLPKLTTSDSSEVQYEYKEGTDYGFIMFPDNYTAGGEPTRLIVVCHGAGASISDYKSDAWKDNQAEAYWTRFGYAIMDMFACPAELSGSEGQMHYGNPIVLQCYIKGIDYVMKHYNLKRDGIFVIGSSMGGLSSFQIVQSGCVKVLAQIGNCPCIDIFKQAYCNPWSTSTTQRSKIADYFGFEGEKPTFTDQKPPSQPEIDYFKNNFDKVVGYYPILKNVVSGDIKSIFDAIPADITTLYDEQEKNIYDKLTSVHPCPIMIFHCKNDSTVAYRYSEYFINMVRRSGQLAYFRPFAVGGHQSWEAGDNITVKDANDRDITIPAAKYESYLFFNRFDDYK